jgi:hypothetical protein
MLKADYAPELTPLDHQVFSQLVPEDHYLRRLKTAVDFSSRRPLLADCYMAERGRGALNPVCLLKLLLDLSRGQQTATRSHDKRDHLWQFRFSAAQCHDCPLRAQRLKPEIRNGRSVDKSDYPDVAPNGAREKT